MPLFTVNEDLCVKDGMCVQECPAGIIEMKDGNSFPSLVEGGAKRCINCGHCVAVCPHGAMSLATMLSEACPTITSDQLPTADSVDRLLRARRSIRAYKDAAVPTSLLESLISTARFAPTGSNSQMVEWNIANGRDKTKKLAGLVVEWFESIIGSKHPLNNYDLNAIVGAFKAGHDGILRGAPTLAVAHAPKANPIGSMDCTIAATTLEIAAFSRGLGTCWAGFLLMAAMSYAPLSEALGIPEDNIAGAALMMGFQKFGYSRIPVRRSTEITWL